MTCRHTDTEPVDVRNPATGATETVAHICRTCLEQLPANWGCPACEWDEIANRRLCEPVQSTVTICTRPCEEHA